MPYAGYLLFSGAESLASYERQLPALSEPPIVALARAIAANPGWPAGSDPVLVARRSPQPELLVLGRFEADGEAWLRCQTHALDHACSHLRYVGYPQVQRDCERLAGLLQDRLGPELAQARLVAIPRGGFVVLGLLAALLPLSSPGDDLLIVVDDCSLSGVRFSRFLKGCGSSRVVFAPLYSHPELRAAVLDRESRVEAVLSATDIQGTRLNDNSARPGGEGYWSGIIEALAFPWNEPDRGVWNPAAGRWETAWRIVPPELCLKNRPRPGAGPIPVQIHPTP